jgi:hemerythrin-like domain-containing protein
MAERSGAMVDPVAVWHAEHMRFERMLAFLEEQMSVFHRGEDPDYALMLDVIHYLHHFADRIHHPREDVAFERLVELDPDLRPSINRLLQEHRVIATAGEKLLHCLEDILEDVVTERSVVEAAAATYLVYYRHHVATEESEILPRAAQLLKPQDWERVASAVAATPDPVFGADVGERYRALRDRILKAA